MKLLLKSAVFVFLLFASKAVLAQSDVTGTVTFGTIRPVPKVSVHLENKTIKPSFEKTQVTDINGDYRFEDVPAGKGYAVTVYDETGKALASDIIVELFPDKPHQALPSIDISKPMRAERALLAGGVIQNDRSTSLGANISNLQLRYLPLYNRNFLALGALQPGVHDVPQGSPLQGAAFSIAGSQPTSTNFLLEGVDNVASSVNQAIPFQINEAVQEFRLIYAAPDMRYGQGIGGVIDVVTSRASAPTASTRSSAPTLSKAWHGSAFEYFNSDSLNANSPLSVYSTSGFAKAAANASNGAGDSANDLSIAISTPGYLGYAPQRYNQLLNLVTPGSPISSTSPLANNCTRTALCTAGSFAPGSILNTQDSHTYPITSQQFGASVGGPYKDKYFFFLSYEGTRIDNPTPIFERVPTSLDSAFGTNAADTAIASNILGLLPRPNVGQTGAAVLQGTGAGIFGFYRGYAPNYTHVHNVHFRPEVSLGTKGTLSLRFTGQLIDQLHDDTLPSGGAYPGNGAFRKGQNQSAAVTHSFPFGNNLNVANIGFTQFRVDEVAQDRNFSSAAVGLRAGALSTYAISGIDTRTTGAAVGTPGLMGGWYDSFWNACSNGTISCGTANTSSPSPITPSLDGQFPLARIGAPLSAPGKHRDTEAFFSDILDLHLGSRNLLTVGGDYRYQQNFSYDGGLARGLVVSNNIGEFTSDSETCISCGVGIAFQHPSFDYELRQPSGYTGDLRSSSFGIFGENKFQPRPNLTLSVGVRYEYFGQQLDTANRLWNYNVAAQGLNRQSLTGTYDAFDYQCGASKNTDGTSAATLDSLYGIRRVNFTSGWRCDPNSAFSLPSNKNNVMGHFGLAYSPDASYHNVFRASGGLYYDHLPSSYNEQLLHNRPSPYNVGNPSAIYGQNFESTGCGSTQSQCGYGLHTLAFQNLNTTDAANFQNYQAASGANIMYERDPKNLQTPYSIQFAASVQHTFGSSWAGEIAYVGSANKHLPLIYDGNFINEFYCTQGGGSASSPGGLCNNNTFFPVFTESHFGASSYHSLVMRLRSEQYHGLSVHAAYTYSKSLDDIAGSSFPRSTDALWSQIFGRQLFGQGNPIAFAFGGASFTTPAGVNRQRFTAVQSQSNGSLSALGAQVSSKSNIPSFQSVASALTTTGSRTVDVSQYSLPQNPIGFTSHNLTDGGDYGRSDFDVTHRVVADFVYIPNFHNKWLKNFVVSGIFTAQSGQPFTIFAGPAYGQITQRIKTNSFSPVTTTGNPNAYISGVGLPNYVSLNNPSCPNLYAQPTLYVNTTTNAAACVGNSSRNGYTGPIYMSQDVALQRDIHWRESQSITLRVEGFNLFNRSNYYNPISELSDDGIHLNPEFGLIRSAHDPFSLQFAARYQF